MSREIKFRAWDGKKMWYDGDIYQNGNDYSRSYPCQVTNRGIEYIKTYETKYKETIRDEQGREGYQAWDLEKTNSKVEIMQYTGLKDKNGNEIYEGDICKFIDHPTDVDTCISCVKFSEGNFIDGYMGWPINNYGSDWIEILGNIHQNPELP
jgi:uncharacterized phage protein (TIGR01671 family)